MIKHLKYLISFLLIFGLTVNQCSISSQINSTNYHQVSFLNNRNGFSYGQSELYTYTGQTLPRKILSSPLELLINIKDFYNAQVQIILKLRTELYRNICSIRAQCVFLSEIITSSNYYSNLYIA